MMRIVSLSVVFFCSFLSCLYGQLQSPDEQVKAALQILNGWHAGAPKPGDRSLHLICWTPSDREFPKEYQARLTRIMSHIQEFYLREMERHGLGSRTFNLIRDDNERLLLHTVKGQHPTEHYGVPSGTEIRDECWPTLKAAGIDPDNETVMLLCNLGNWDEKQLRFTHKSPYYAGGSFRRGTAWQLDSPELDTRNLELKKPMIRDGQYGRISLGKHNSIFIGGVAHELGHALGLPHCKARPDEAVRGTALMGSGNRTYGDELRGEGRGTFLTLAHALRLASHPQFSGSVKGLNQRAQADITDIVIEADGKAIKVAGTVEGKPPVYAVVAYFDPEGGGDYNAATATAVPSADGRFELSCNALPRGRPGELRLFPLHVNGSAAGQMSRTRFRYSYNITADGTPDLSTIQTKQELAKIIEALRDNNKAAAARLVAGLKSDKAKRVATRLIDPPLPTRPPSAYAGNDKSVPLTNFLIDAAKVGWQKPAFDRVPDENILIESGGEISETGIYAHAPARHVYQLGAKWKSMSGKVGLATGHSGSVQFEIKGDGKSLWKSKIIKSNITQEFDVRLSGVRELELLTDPTADGAGADWGMWLAPKLSR